MDDEVDRTIDKTRKRIHAWCFFSKHISKLPKHIRFFIELSVLEAVALNFYQPRHNDFKLTIHIKDRKIVKIAGTMRLSLSYQRQVPRHWERSAY